MKDDPDLGALTQDVWPWPGQLLAGDAALGGLFALNDAADLGALPQEEEPRLAQLLEASPALGGRFAPKFIPPVRVPVVKALTSELPSPRPLGPFIPRVPLNPVVRPPKYAELLLPRVPHPLDLPYDPPPVCRGAADRPPQKPFPPKCPPPPPWNPPPPLLPP